MSEHQASALQAGQRLMIDGHSGLISSVGQARQASASPLPLKPGEPLQTADGHHVVLRTSIGTLESAQRARQVGASGVGLVRSERFNPADGGLPDAEFYRHTFGELCEMVAPLSVTVRLIDIAQDKLPPWLGEIAGCRDRLA